MSSTALARTGAVRPAPRPLRRSSKSAWCVAFSPGPSKSSLLAAFDDCGMALSRRGSTMIIVSVAKPCSGHFQCKAVTRGCTSCNYGESLVGPRHGGIGWFEMLHLIANGRSGEAALELRDPRSRAALGRNTPLGRS